MSVMLRQGGDVLKNTICTKYAEIFVDDGLILGADRVVVEVGLVLLMAEAVHELQQC